MDVGSSIGKYKPYDYSQSIQQRNCTVGQGVLVGEGDNEIQKTSNNSLDLLGLNIPQRVKDAWENAEKEVGVNGLGMDETRKLTHISTMLTLQAEQRLSTGSYDFLGKSKESAIGAVKKALERLNNPLQPENDPMIREYKEKEKLFYESFLSNLQSS